MNELNFNIQNIIFSFLDFFDIIHTININKKFRSLIYKYNNLYHKDSLKVFCFLYNLRNIKNSDNKNSFFINYYRNVCLFSAVKKRFSNIDLDDIANGFYLYFNIHRKEYNYNKIHLNLNSLFAEKRLSNINLNNIPRLYNNFTEEYNNKIDLELNSLFAEKRRSYINLDYIPNQYPRFYNYFKHEYDDNKINFNLDLKKAEFLLMLKIIKKLDQEKFIYIITFPDHMNSNTYYLLRIFDNIKYIECFDGIEKKYLFNFLGENNIKVFFTKKNNFLNFENRKQIESANKYFQIFPNNIEQIDIRYLKYFYERSGLDILLNNSDSIKKISFKRNLADYFLGLVELYPDLLKNLKKIHFINPDPYFFIYKFIKDRKTSLKLSLRKYVKFLDPELNLESLELKNVKPSRFLPFKDTLKKLRITTSHKKKIFSYNKYLVFHNLKILEINFSFIKDKFYFDKFFKINCHNLSKNVLSLFIIVLRNNENELRNIFVESTKIDILNEAFDYLESSEFNSISHQIKGIKLTDTSTNNIGKFSSKIYFENLHEIEIEDYELYPIIRYTKTLDRLILKDHNKFAETSMFNELKDKNLRMFEAYYVDADRLYKVIKDNLANFKNLIYIRIHKTTISQFFYKTYIEELQYLNPIFLEVCPDNFKIDE
jgi:hypothetical protein